MRMEIFLRHLSPVYRTEEKTGVDRAKTITK